MPQKMELALTYFVQVSSGFVDDTIPGAGRECPMSSLCVCHYIYKGAETLGISYVVSQTQMSIADCSQASDIVEGSPPSIEHHLEGCIADIRTSRYVVSRRPLILVVPEQ